MEGEESFLEPRGYIVNYAFRLLYILLLERPTTCDLEA